MLEHPDRPPVMSLQADLLLEAYARGLFPMAIPEWDDRIAWFCPDPRGIIPLEGFRVPRSLRRVMRSGRFAFRSDTAFGEVITACAEPRLRPRDLEEHPDEHDDDTDADPADLEGTWISDDIRRAYVDLHERGHAHSIEAWRDDQLVGGLYGVALGGAFFGESMFVRPDAGGTDASKACLAVLVGHMRRQGFRLLDTQYVTPHLARFGAIEIPRSAYLGRLAEATASNGATWRPFDPDAALAAAVG